MNTVQVCPNDSLLGSIRNVLRTRLKFRVGLQMKSGCNSLQVSPWPESTLLFPSLLLLAKKAVLISLEASVGWLRKRFWTDKDYVSNDHKEIYYTVS